MRRQVVRAMGAVFMVLWIASGVLAPAVGHTQELAVAQTAVMDSTALAAVTGGNGACAFLDGVGVGLGIGGLFGCVPCAVGGVVAGGAGLLCSWFF
jgi:hypothetical protein